MTRDLGRWKKPQESRPSTRENKRRVEELGATKKYEQSDSSTFCRLALTKADRKSRFAPPVNGWNCSSRVCLTAAEMIKAVDLKHVSDGINRMSARCQWALVPVFVACFAMPASAENWSGFYGGFSAGYQSGQTDWTLLENAGNEISGQIGSVVTNNDPNGFVGGVHVGYNRQWGNFVAGVEAEASVLGSEGYSTWNNQAGLFRDATVDHNWLAAISARGGFIFNQNRDFAFGKIGVAAINSDYVHTGGSAGSPRVLTGDATSIGILFGVGIEHALTQNVALRIEYDYLNVPSDGISVTQGNRTAVFGIDQDIHAIKAGFVFRFGQ